MMNPRKTLTDWIQQLYGGKQIKLTDQPYTDHLFFVANTAGAVSELGYEIGLCHDLLEDFDITAHELQNKLQYFGYDLIIASAITTCVTELTDVFTKAAYPALSKAERKQKEAQRLARVSSAAQTVKYADLIDNSRWMLAYERNKAKTYLLKKLDLIVLLDKGEKGLQKQALEWFTASLSQLAEH